MAKKKGKRRKAQMTLPLAVVAGFLPAGGKIYAARGSVEDMSETASRIFTGFDPGSGNWDFEDMKYGIAPVFVGFMVHKIASGLGINRALGAARVPFIRI